MATKKDDEFVKKLEDFLNSYSKESENDTPDFILAEYMNDCLKAYTKAINNRNKFYNSK